MATGGSEDDEDEYEAMSNLFTTPPTSASDDGDDDEASAKPALQQQRSQCVQDTQPPSPPLSESQTAVRVAEQSVLPNLEGELSVGEPEIVCPYTGSSIENFRQLEHELDKYRVKQTLLVDEALLDQVKPAASHSQGHKFVEQYTSSSVNNCALRLQDPQDGIVVVCDLKTEKELQDKLKDTDKSERMQRVFPYVKHFSDSPVQIVEDRHGQGKQTISNLLIEGRTGVYPKANELRKLKKKSRMLSP